MAYRAIKLPSPCVHFKLSSPWATAVIVGKRKLLDGFGMWPSNVSSVLEGCYYIVSIQSKQRMLPSQHTFIDFSVGKLGLALGSNHQVSLQNIFSDIGC